MSERRQTLSLFLYVAGYIFDLSCLWLDYKSAPKEHLLRYRVRQAYVVETSPADENNHCPGTELIRHS
jgi:hypothetical protein